MSLKYEPTRQLPMENGEIIYKGKVPSQRTEEEAYKSARMCGLNIIAQVSPNPLDLMGDLPAWGMYLNR